MQKFYQNKKLRVAVAVQAAAVAVFALFALLAPKSSVTIDAAHLQALSGNTQNGARALDDSFGYLGEFTKTPSLTLPRGSYTIELDYSCNHAWNLMHNEAQSEGAVWYDGEITLPQTTRGIYSRVWVWGESAQLVTSTEYRVGRLEVREVRVRENNDMALLVIYAAAVLFAAADVLAWQLTNGSLRREFKERRAVFCILAAAVFIASIPLLWPGLYPGHDLSFHLLRIEGLKEALLHGQIFPVRMRVYEAFGYGYGTSLFYPELFLYPFALLRMMRIPLFEVFRLFQFTTNAAAAIIAYYSFKLVFKKRVPCAVAAAVYTVSAWRIVNVYLRASIGTAVSMAFFPLIIAALYCMLCADTESREFKYGWLLGVVGYSGALQSHLASTEIIGLTTILICVAYIKRAFVPKRLGRLALTVGASAALNAWSLAPMFDAMRQEYSMNSFVGAVQSAGLLINQLFRMDVPCGGVTKPIEQGIEGEMPFGIGAVLLTATAVFIIAVILNRKEKSARRRFAVTAFVVALVLMFMTTIYFPWQALHEMGGLVNRILVMFEFPWRLLSAVTILLAFAACYGICCISERANGLKITAAALCVACVAQWAVFLSGYYGGYYVVDTYGVRSTEFVGASFLPGGCTMETVADLDKLYPEGDGCEVSDYSKDGTHIEMRVVNAKNSAAALEVPLLNYVGYKATGDDGEALELTKGENGTLAVVIPAGYDGGVEINYVGRPLWRASEAVSLLTLAGMIVWYKRDKKGRQA